MFPLDDRFYYAKQITLANIAEAGNIGKSRSSAMFQKFLHRSPMNYLRELHLGAAREMPETTDLTITEISIKCGFQGASYLTECFHRQYGITPSDYRTQLSYLSDVLAFDGFILFPGKNFRKQLIFETSQLLVEGVRDINSLHPVSETFFVKFYISAFLANLYIL